MPQSSSRKKIDRLFVKSANLDVQDRLDLLHDTFRGLFKVVLDEDSDASVVVDAWALGDIVVGKYTHGNYSLQRDTTSEFVALRIFLSGYAQVDMNGSSVLMRPGYAYLLNFNTPLRYSGPSRQHLSVSLPFSSIGFDPSIHSPLTSLSLHSPIGKTIGALMRDAYSSVGETGEKERVVIANGLIGILQGVLSRGFANSTERTSFAASREETIRHFIEENLNNPRLDADMICDANAVSRATLYRILQDDGGVNEVIKNLRLDAVHNDLKTTGRNHGSIKRISQSWCFSDSAHFTRAFNNRFGYKPSELRKASQSELHCDRLHSDMANCFAKPRKQSLTEFYFSRFR